MTRPKTIPLSHELGGLLALTFTVSFIFTIAGVWWFSASRHQEATLRSDLELVSAKAHMEKAEFERILVWRKTAQLHYDRAIATLSDAQVQSRFARWFVEKSDGTWRSRDGLYDGVTDSAYGAMRGFGAFISPGPMPLERKRRLVSALSALQSVVESDPTADNLSYFSLANEVIVYAPARADRLKSYRKTAPATFDFSSTPMMANVAQNTAKAGVLRCLPPTRAIWDKTGRGLVAGCQAPVQSAQGPLAGWGVTLMLDQHFGAMLEHGSSERHVVVASEAGDIIAASQLGAAETADVSAFQAVSDLYQWSAMREALARAGTEPTSILQPNLRWVATQAAIDMPGWRLVYLRDRTQLLMAPLMGAQPLAISILAILGAIILIFSVYVRVRIIRPLRTIQALHSAEHQDVEASARAGEMGPPTEVERQKPQFTSTEIAELAGTLARYRAQVADAVAALEERVEERTGALRQARDTAQLALKAKDVFLANMSHEIRTPLNGVLGLAGALADTSLTDRQREMVTLIQASGDTLSRLVSDVLDFSKIEAGKMELECTAFDLCEAVHFAASVLKERAEQKGLAFNISLEPEARGLFKGDAIRVRQIVSNLVSNAIKFTQVGAVNVHVGVKVVHDGSSEVVLTVSDTGIGFDEEAKARLFTRFEQADGSITRLYGGTGLGLAICRNLANLMGGDIAVRSQPGVGSEFVVTLPLDRDSAPAPRIGYGRPESHAGHIMPVNDNAALAPSSDGAGIGAEDEVGAEDDADAQRGLRILLADDHAVNQRVVSLILEPFNVDLTMVDNGRLALEAFCSDAFDLVIMDMQMPVMDGLEATRRLRAFEVAQGRAPTPVIMLSANAMQSHRDDALKAGCTLHVSKPVTPAELIAGIQTALAHEADPVNAGQSAPVSVLA